MTWTGGDVLWAGATVVATPAAVVLLALAALSAVGAVGRASRRSALAPGLGLAVVFSLTLWLRDPLLARPLVWPHALVGAAFLALGWWRWRRPSGFLPPGLLAPGLGLALAFLRPPVAGPRLLLLYGADGGAALPRWLYHLGTGLALAGAFLVVHAVLAGAGERVTRTWGAWGWMLAGVGIGVGGYAWVTQWLLLRWPPGTLG